MNQCRFIKSDLFTKTLLMVFVFTFILLFSSRGFAFADDKEGFKIGDTNWNYTGLDGYFVGELNGRFLLSGGVNKGEIYSISMNEKGDGIKKEIVYDFSKKNPLYDKKNQDNNCFVMYHFRDTHVLFESTISQEHITPEDSSQNYFNKYLDVIQFDKQGQITENKFNIDIPATNRTGYTEWQIVNMKMVKNKYQMFIVEWYNGTQINRSVYESDNMIDWKYLRKMASTKDDPPSTYISFKSRDTKKYGLLYNQIESSIKKYANISNTINDNTGVNCTQAEIKRAGTSLIFMNYRVQKCFEERTIKGDGFSVLERITTQYQFNIIASTSDYKKYKFIYPESIDEISKEIGVAIKLKTDFKKSMYPLIKEIIKESEGQNVLPNGDYQATKEKIENSLREIVKTDILIKKKYNIINNSIDIAGAENSKKLYWEGGNGSKFAFSKDGTGVISSYLGEFETGEIGDIKDFLNTIKTIDGWRGYPCEPCGFFNIGRNSTTLCMIKDGKIDFSNYYFFDVMPFENGFIASKDRKLYFAKLH